MGEYDCWVGNKADELFWEGQLFYSPTITSGKEPNKWHPKEDVFSGEILTLSHITPQCLRIKSDKFRVSNYEKESELIFQRMDAFNLKHNPQLRVFHSKKYQEAIYG